MKKRDGFWIDENGNRWDADIYTKEIAIGLSATLVNCADCRNCADCENCRDCVDCEDFGENPLRYTGEKMGSRNSQTTTYWTNEKNQVVCGCFTGTINDFEKRVSDVYGDTGHGAEYARYIKIVRMIMA